MVTTPSMGLKRWDSPNDIFSYTEVANNFSLIDGHDHSSGKGVQIPTAGIANLAVTETQIATDAVTAGKIAANAVIAAKVLNGTLTDTKLASPNNGIWRALWSAGAPVPASTGIGTYLMGYGAAVASTAASATFIPTFYWDPTHYAVAGKTTTHRIAATVATNPTAPTTSFTVGLFPFSSGGGGAGTISSTVGTMVAGSGATFTTPGASARGVAYSTDFTALPSGQYLLGYSIASGTTAVNSLVLLSAFLQTKHV